MVFRFFGFLRFLGFLGVLGFLGFLGFPAPGRKPALHSQLPVMFVIGCGRLRRDPCQPLSP